MDRREERDFFWLWGLSSEWSSFDFLHFPVDPLSLSFLSHSFSIQFLNILSSYISPCTNKTLSSWLPVFSYCFPGTSFYSCNAVINSVVSLYCHSPCLVVQLTPLPPKKNNTFLPFWYIQQQQQFYQRQAIHFFVFATKVFFFSSIAIRLICMCRISDFFEGWETGKEVDWMES